MSNALYSDLNQDFGPGKPSILEDVASVTQHMDNLLEIKPRQMLFEPELGADLDGVLFDIVDDETTDAVYVVTSAAWRRWDDRINVNIALSTVEADPDQGRYAFSYVTTIRGLTGEYDYSGHLLAGLRGA